MSPTLVFNKENPNKPIAYKRLQACEPDKGDFQRDNENSALVWHYGGNNPKKPDEALHRTLTTGRATYWSRSRGSAPGRMATNSSPPIRARMSSAPPWRWAAATSGA